MGAIGAKIAIDFYTVNKKVTNNTQKSIIIVFKIILYFKHIYKFDPK